MASRTSDGIRLLVEGVVVLVSILAAFFLEGWRDDRELARELSQELANVQRELEANRDFIAREVESLDRILSGSAALLSMLDSAAGVADVQVPDTLAWIVMAWVPTLDPSLGAVDALITTGRLAQIDNPELRMGLAGLKDRLADAIEEEVNSRRIVIEQLYPLLRDGLDVGAVLRVGDAFFGGADATGRPPQERAGGRSLPFSGTVSFPNSPAVRNTIRFKAGWLSVGRVEFGELLPQMDALVALVEQELE